MRDNSAYWDEKRPRPKNSWTEWHVSIVQADFYEGERNGTLTSQLYPLRFCPSCGSPIPDADKLTR